MGTRGVVQTGRVPALQDEALSSNPNPTKTKQYKSKPKNHCGTHPEREGEKGREEKFCLLLLNKKQHICNCILCSSPESM
jgi:hypothetical protein